MRTFSSTPWTTAVRRYGWARRDVRDLDPDLSPSGVLAWRRGPDPATDAADIVTDGRNLTEAAQENNWGPAWSPDGSRLAYSSTRDAGTVPRVWTMAADGTDQRLVMSGHGEYPDWSPDGTQLVFAAPGAAGAYDIFIVPVDGGEPTSIVDHAGHRLLSDLVADGRWIAFHRLEAGVFVYGPMARPRSEFPRTPTPVGRSGHRMVASAGAGVAASG